ncbi:MAG: hypothetical protein GX589_10010 [Deltaproteobacteria bacterium]|nr:hypothetical protein [Deltaproteobacteria bacterium]
MKQKKRSDLEQGASLVEYAILVVVLALVGIVSLEFLGEKVSSAYKGVANVIAAGGDTSRHDGDPGNSDNEVPPAGCGNGGDCRP